MKPCTKALKLSGLILAIGLTGCYAANIDTGRSPSNKVIRQEWASCWIYGLVPPKTVETAAKCPEGVARVETQLSFLNQVVSFLTLGIYTPMQIVVTCAEGSRSSISPGSEIDLAENATPQEVREAFARAADQAVKTRQPVYVCRI